MLLRKSTLASPTPQGKKKSTNKIIAGFAALAVTAIVATSGLAAAATPNHKPSKEACMKAGFKNYGQCIKEWEAAKNHPGSGYGGGNTSVAVSLNNLTISNSNNNVIQVIVNIFR